MSETVGAGRRVAIVGDAKRHAGPALPPEDQAAPGLTRQGEGGVGRRG